MSSGSWSGARRVAFRVLFAFAVLRMLPFPINLVPGAEPVAGQYLDLSQKLALGVGRGLLRMTGEIPLAPTGSGDRTIDYLSLLTALLFALVIAGLWSALDRRRTDYQRMAARLRVAVRYYLAAQMIGYGIVKVFHTQFPMPLAKLVQTFGQSTPMSLLWTFMGYSIPYQVLTGVVELVGALLLFARRTTLLGSLVLAGALTNVVALNFTFDVPVKILSTQLLIMALALAAPDLPRLARLLVLNRPVPPADLGAPPAGVVPRRLHRIAKVVAIGAATLGPLVSELEYLRGLASPLPLVGLYDVTELRRGDVEIPANLDQPARWRRVAIDPYGLRVVRMDDSAVRYRAKYDLERQRIQLEDWQTPGVKHELAWRDDAGEWTLSGPLAGEEIHARLRKLDPRSFPLLGRGFHWVNEVPHNR